MPNLTRNGESLYYEQCGSGPALLLIHGAVSSGRCFAEHVPLLAGDFTVVVPDLRGMGRSSSLEHKTPTAWTEDLRALLDRLGIERAHVCGTSLGARIALRLALELPDRVASVVADSPIVADSAAGTAALEHAFGSGLTDQLARLFESWNGPEWRAILANYLELRRHPGLQAYYDLRRALDMLRCPVLVARGDIDDEIHPLRHAIDVHARVPESALWIAPSTPFSAVRSRPADFARIYRPFIAALEPGNA